MAGLPTLNRNRHGQLDSGNDGDADDIVISIRKAAAKGMETRPPSDGNKESVEKAPAAPVSKKTQPPPPAKAGPDKNKAAPERTPPFAKDPVSGDGWARAREAARKMHRGK